MIIDIVPISSLRFEKVQYYSIYIDHKPLTEFRDFIKRMAEKDDCIIELGEINRHIQRIGQKLGAHPHHFKSEDAAEALPPPYHYFESDLTGAYGLRLYCIRLSPSIVILLNGDRKTALKVNKCPHCFPHFDLARKLSKKITQAIVDRDIEIDEENKEIIIYDDYELIL